MRGKRREDKDKDSKLPQLSLSEIRDSRLIIQLLCQASNCYASSSWLSFLTYKLEHGDNCHSLASEHYFGSDVAAEKSATSSVKVRDEEPGRL